MKSLFQKSIILSTSIFMLGACSAEFGIKGVRNGPVDVFDDAGTQPGERAGDGNTICDPFSKENIVDAQFGLEGEIRYLRDDQPRYILTSQHKEFGNRVNADLFLSKLDVPTRSFDKGFVTEGGTRIERDDGELLTEWFSLHVESSLALAPWNPAGKYQLAILSDDGASLRIQDEFGNWQTVVNNEGQHQTRMMCALAPVELNHHSRLKMQLDYFQGPRYHISMIVLWRPWPEDSAKIDEPLCGQSGNSLFFDSTKTPSQPKQAYKDLLARGWKPLETENFVLEDSFNKCSTR